MKKSDNALDVFSSLVQQRRSVRAFLRQQVPQEQLIQILEIAARTPSNCNTQPWCMHLVSGAALEALRDVLPAHFTAGELSLDFPYEGRYNGVFKERQYASAQALYESQGIARGDKMARSESFMRNFIFFDAPHVAFIFLPEPFGLREAADVGMYVQSFLLALTAAGLGGCPQTALSFFAEPVRAQLGIDESQKLLLGISLGYPDWDASVNQCRTNRAPLSQTVSIHT